MCLVVLVAGHAALHPVAGKDRLRVSGQALGQFGPIAHGQQPAAGQHLIQHAQQGRGQLAHAGLGDAEAGGLVFLQGVALEV
ncbi:MAG TPA: hypothetical protein VF630_05575, partial [Hymenobacter sp.]